MLHAEAVARSHGASSIGLNVFTPNTVARHLYGSLGYATVSVHPYSVNMAKAL
jgi:ribosomal protein S18 acetylase RimI-like enzyme